MRGSERPVSSAAHGVRVAGLPQAVALLFSIQAVHRACWAYSTLLAYQVSISIASSDRHALTGPHLALIDGKQYIVII